MVNVAPPPYGLTPTVASTTIAGMEARLIAPSADQPPERNGEIAFVVRYPKPLRIENNGYFFFVLYGDPDHAQSIADTLSFISE